jgi:hypothetical protein
MIEKIKVADLMCKYDPWLNERVFLKNVREVVETENVFQDTVLQIKCQIRDYDKLIIEKFKEILGDLNKTVGSNMNNEVHLFLRGWFLIH